MALWIKPVNAECTTGLHDSDTHKSLFGSWSAFAEANGETPGSGRDFHELMVGAGFKATKHTPLHHVHRGYLGITVRRPDPANWSDPP